MRTALDGAGRIVVPKALRVPAPTPMRLVDEGDGVAAIANVEMPVLTAAMVRETLERIRR